MGIRPSVLSTRLDALLYVLKSCKGDACRSPWRFILPDKEIKNLLEALSPQYDDLFGQIPKVSFSACEGGYVIAAEGAQWSGVPLLSSDLRARDGSDPDWALLT